MIPTLTFDNPVFNRLYQKDFFIDEAVLREILALGPDAAIPELLKIADETLTNFDPDGPEGADWFRSFYFLHALYLLHDLRAPQALDLYLRLLRKPQLYQEYWFGDTIYEELPVLIARAGHDRLPELMAAMDDDTYTLDSRNIMSNALLMIASDYPAQRPVVIEFYRRYLQQVIANADRIEEAYPADEDGAYGYDVHTHVAFMLAELQDINATELLDEMQQVHRLGLVDESIAGGEKDIEFRPRPALAPPPADIFARYAQIKSWLADDSPFNPEAAAIRLRKSLEEQNRRRSLSTSVPLEPKVGRNDPCPCGSGKKYKKCCME